MYHLVDGSCHIQQNQPHIFLVFTAFVILNEAVANSIDAQEPLP